MVLISVRYQKSTKLEHQFRTFFENLSIAPFYLRISLIHVLLEPRIETFLGQIQAMQMQGGAILGFLRIFAALTTIPKRPVML